MAGTIEITGSTSDGYHTFDELYEHRHVLFMKLCEVAYQQDFPVWRTLLHSDGSSYPGWFILGINTEAGKQISYHLPERLWERAFNFTQDLERAPEFDGHTAADVLKRIGELDIFAD